MTTIVGVISRPALVPGFALVGVRAHPVSPDEDAEAIVSSFRNRGNVGVVLLEEAIYDALPEDARARLDRSAAPVVVPFPGPSWSEAVSAEARVVDLLRRAIGYRVKLR